MLHVMRWKRFGKEKENKLMRDKDINGEYINNPIGYCNCAKHPGALNRKIAYDHKCIAKHCKHLMKYDEGSWRIKQSYRNRR